MKKLARDLLERVAGSVLEDAAFVFAMPSTEDPPVLSGWHAVGARLDFEGPLTGYCELWAPFEIAKLLSANMLGMEDDSPDAQEMCFDALKEALNILCGNLLTEVAGPAPVFNLGTPTTQKAPEALPDDMNGTEAWLETDGYMILVRVCLKRESTEAA